MNKFYDLYNLVMEGLDNKSQDVNDIVNDIINKLNSDNFFKQDPQIKNKIIKYLNILRNDREPGTSNFDILLNLLTASPSDNGIGLDKEQAKIIASEIDDRFEIDTVKSLINYLKNRFLNVENFADGSKRSFKELFDAAKLINEQDELISYLYDKKLNAQAATGKGELLFALIFSEAHKPQGKSANESGDVIVNNKNLEVKGSGARLGGQSGYGKGFSATKFIKSEFIDIIKNEELVNEIKTIDPLSFNFKDGNLNDSTNPFLTLCNISARNNPSFSIDDAREILKGAFKQIYVNEDAFNEALESYNFLDFLTVTESSNNNDHDFENINAYKKLNAEKSIMKNEYDSIKTRGANPTPEEKQRKNELHIKIKKLDEKIKEYKNKFTSSTKFKIDNNQFKTMLLLFSLKYYKIVDGFSYFSLSNGKNFALFNAEALNDKNTILKTISIKSMLSFGDKAGGQGEKVSIELK